MPERIGGHSAQLNNVSKKRFDRSGLLTMRLRKTLNLFMKPIRGTPYEMTVQDLHSPQKKTTRRGDRTRKTRSVDPSKAKRSRTNGSRSNSSTQPKVSFDRYIALAHAAATAGNAIEAENYYQHAEHYFRLMKQRSAKPGGSTESRQDASATV